jgi:hypothetical protein
MVCLLPIARLMAGEPAMEPVPPEAKADYGFPAQGTKWVGRLVYPRGPTITLTYTVIEDGMYDNKPVHRVRAGPATIMHDKNTGNPIASFRLGKESTSTIPHDGTLDWPLFVGKSWTATYTYNNRLQGMSVGPIHVQFKVTAYEDITVPAGTWKAFKLESETSNNVVSTLWYVPEINLFVKKITETQLGHPLGRSKTLFEIIEYTPPGKKPHG